MVMMTPELAAEYERAAAVLENGAMWESVIEWKAWDKAFDDAPAGSTDRDINNRAARILRECIEKGEPLP